MIDFTPDSYSRMLTALLAANYRFVSVEDYFSGIGNDRMVILRHDIDSSPKRALTIAGIESELNIKSTFYFRYSIARKCPDIVKSIVSLGHEVGYHYEELSLAKGDYDKALCLFEKRLDFMRSLCGIKTMAMHGSPLSAYDNKALWKKVDYRRYGIIGEPYLDIDYSDCLYLTDSGGSWDGVTVRDKVESTMVGKFHFHSTDDIIVATDSGNMPDRVAITTHPERWIPFGFTYVCYFGLQKIKNLIKYIVLKLRK